MMITDLHSELIRKLLARFLLDNLDREQVKENIKAIEGQLDELAAEYNG